MKDMEKLPITVVVLTKNEEQMIVNCIETVQWCQEIVVIDSQSTDSTAALAKRAGAIVYTTDKDSFAERRNYGLTKVRTPWVFYLDADERVTPDLMMEIKSAIRDGSINALRLHRHNYHYGKMMNYGGWEKDQLVRIFRTEALTTWSGKVHESAQFSGQEKLLKASLVHLTHRNMVEGLYKTISWTHDEAQLLFEAHHPPVTRFTLLRKTIMEFLRRAFFWHGKKDGMEGWIEAMVQAMNKFIVYEQLWELQQTPTLREKYQKLDEDIIRQWENQTDNT